MAKVAKRRGRYVIDFYDHQGKRRWKTLPAGTTKKKAKEALRDIEDQLARGIYIPDKKIPTFGEVVNDWLEYKRLNLRESTWVSYECSARKNLYGTMTQKKATRSKALINLQNWILPAHHNFI